jgi:transketolase
MRKKFSELLYKEMSKNNKIILLTGDLGYGLWDKIKLDYPDRFFNTGSCEQFMMGAAVGMALEGKIPFVYSITSFLLYRPFEFIRNYLNHESIPVKLIGGGRDRDYGNLGFSHWSEDHLDSINHFTNIIKFCPQSEIELETSFQKILETNFSCYLNLKR